MELWENYHHCPRCGAGIAAFEPPLRCGSCGFVRYFNPTCAVAAFLLEPGGRALFIRRACEPALGKLAMAGGFIDPGETAEEALLRELREEVGVELHSPSYLGSWPNRYPTAAGVVDICDFFFTGRVSSMQTALQADEVRAVEWLRPEEVEPAELAFDSMREALAEWLRRR